jgi:hypothetical protein
MFATATIRAAAGRAPRAFPPRIAAWLGRLPNG